MKKLLKISQLEKERNDILKQISSFDYFIRGCITTLNRKVGNKIYPAIYFSANINAKTKLVHLGKKKKELAQAWLNNYSEFKILIDKLIEINLEILRLKNVQF